VGGGGSLTMQTFGVSLLTPVTHYTVQKSEITIANIRGWAIWVFSMGDIDI